MTPTAMTRLDRCSPKLEEAQTAVRRALGSRLRGFRITLQPGGLILEGKAFNYYTKQMAQHLVMKCFENRILANSIAVPGTGDPWELGMSGPGE